MEYGQGRLPTYCAGGCEVKRLLLLAACFWIPLAAAQDMKSFVRGSQQAILSAHHGKPFILALWSVDCSHCRDDLMLLGRLAKKYPKLDVVLVSTDTPEQKQALAQTLQRYRLGRAESWVFADSFAERLRYEIDPQWYGELPRTYFFGAQEKTEAISGRLEPEQVERWIRENRAGG